MPLPPNRCEAGNEARAAGSETIQPDNEKLRKKKRINKSIITHSKQKGKKNKCGD